MLQIFLRKFFAKTFYPTNSNDWYKNKGYKGQDDAARFANFLARQRERGARFYNEFTSLQLTRQYIQSGSNQLDSVLIVPNQDISLGKPGGGLYFIMFQGREEYYESRFRDMARQARETGASVLGFNPKGFHCSKGKTRQLTDIVDDGIAVVDFLLQRGVKYEQIILQGNSLGAGVQEMVSEHYRTSMRMPFRQINSNSFKSLSAVMAYRYKMPFLEKLFNLLLRYAGWEILPGPDFYKTGPYRCHIRRKGDRTIALGAEYNVMLDAQKDYEDCPESYRETNRWLYKYSQMIYTGKSEKDPHELSLHRFQIQQSDSSTKKSVYYFINRYLKASNTILKIQIH